jgi:hypothetical protein
MKDKLKQRVTSSVEQALRPGERLEAVAYGFTSPLPTLIGYLFEGLIYYLITTPYFVGLTDQRVVFMKVSRMSTKSSSFAFDEPRAQVKVEQFKRGFSWSRMILQLPDRKLRLRFARNSRDEAEQIATALGWTPN